MSTWNLTHISAILTQIIFEHSLKIRIADSSRMSSTSAEAHSSLTSHNTARSETTSVTLNPDESDGNAQTVNPSAGSEESLASTVTSSPGSASNVNPSPTTKPDEGKGPNNVIGKINNLITIDAQQIVDGRDFLFLREFAQTYFHR